MLRPACSWSSQTASKPPNQPTISTSFGEQNCPRAKTRTTRSPASNAFSCAPISPPALQKSRRVAPDYHAQGPPAQQVARGPARFFGFSRTPAAPQSSFQEAVTGKGQKPLKIG